MKNLLLLTMLAVLALGAENSWATDYFFGPGDHRGDLGLVGTDTLLMTGGTIENITLSGNAIADIEGTSPLGSIPSYGGVWSIGNGGYGKLNISGGEINEIVAYNESISNITGGSINSLEMHYKSVSNLYGGEIDTLASDQALLPQGDPGPKGWIQLYCLEHNYDSNNNILTGLWEDSSAFNIQLEDIGIYPTYDLIEFHIIPEPATILLLGLGGLWLRKKNKR